MKDELKKPLVEVVRILGITLAVYGTMRFLLPLVIPFLIALCLAKILYPLVDWLHKKTRLKKGLLSSGILLLFLGGIGWLLWFVGKHLFVQVQALITNFPSYHEKAGIFWHDCCVRMESWTGIREEEFNGRVMEAVPKLWETIRGNLLPALMSGSFSWVRSIFVLAGICIVVGIATLLTVKEYEKIKAVMEKGPLGQATLRILRRVYRAGGGYLKAQLIIMLVVSGICVIGLFCAGNTYALRL